MDVATLLMKNCIDSWEQPSTYYISSIKTLVIEVCEAIIDEVVPSYRNMGNIFKQTSRDVLLERTQQAMLVVQTKREVPLIDY
jgi:hypothetical protein